MGYAKSLKSSKQPSTAAPAYAAWAVGTTGPREDVDWKHVDSETLQDVVHRVTTMGDAILFYSGRDGEYLGIQIYAGDQKIKKTSGSAEEMEMEMMKLLERLTNPH